MHAAGTACTGIRIVRGMVFVFAAHSCDDAMLQGSGDDRRDRRPGRDGERRRRGLPCGRPARRQDGRRTERADARRSPSRRGSSSRRTWTPSSRRRSSCSRSRRPIRRARSPPTSRRSGADGRPAARLGLERGLAFDCSASSRASLRHAGSSSSTGRSPAARRAPTTARASTSPARAAELAEAAPPWLDVRAVVGAEVGLASAVKMCTASVYKGSRRSSRTRS